MQPIASIEKPPSDSGMPTTVSNAGTIPASNSNDNRANSLPVSQQPPNEIDTSPQTESTTTSPTPTPETVRYATGTNLIRPEKTGGRSSLRISNGTSSDAIAKLVDSSTGKTSRLIYIQAGSVATIKDIGSGYYMLKFSLGSGYVKETGKFLNSQSFAKFDDTLDCTVSKMNDGVRWTDHEVTLNPVPGGTARTSTISATEFEDN